MRSPAEARRLPRLAALTLAGAVVGCAFAPGEPWGRAELSLQARFAPGADRLDGEGRLRTDLGYVVAIDVLAIEVGALSLSLSPEGVGGGGGASFDPARPPEGYSNCHGGHCHADDGSLPTYEEIAARLAASGGGVGARVARDGLAPVELGAAPVEVPLQVCPEGCALPRGALQGVGVELVGLTVRGRVFDPLPPARRRLPEEGVELEVALPVDVELSVPIDGAVDAGEPVDVRIAAALTLSPRLLDGLDVAALAAGAGTIALVAEPGDTTTLQDNLLHSELTVQLDRRDDP